MMYRCAHTKQTSDMVHVGKLLEKTLVGAARSLEACLSDQWKQ